MNNHFFLSPSDLQKCDKPSFQGCQTDRIIWRSSLSSFSLSIPSSSTTSPYQTETSPTPTFGCWSALPQPISIHTVLHLPSLFLVPTSSVTPEQTVRSFWAEPKVTDYRITLILEPTFFDHWTHRFCLNKFWSGPRKTINLIHNRDQGSRLDGLVTTLHEPFCWQDTGQRQNSIFQLVLQYVRTLQEIKPHWTNLWHQSFFSDNKLWLVYRLCITATKEEEENIKVPKKFQSLHPYADI